MKNKGFTLIELLIVTAIIGILGTIAIPNFLQAQIRARIAKTNGDMDAVGKASMLFHLEHGRYPHATDNIGESYVSEKVAPADADEFLTFKTNELGAFIPHLTSPISYISFVPIDPFSATPDLTYGYAGGKKGFILTSFGPDRDQHEGINDFLHRGDIDEATAFLGFGREETSGNLLQSLQGVTRRSHSTARLRFYLIQRTYAPSNGLTSNGDLWRSNF